VAVAAVLASLLSLWRIHPFELSYFNGFVGGLRGATKIGLETTYWNDVFTLDFAKMLNEKYAGKTFSRVTGLRYTFRYYKEAGILDPSISQKKEDYDYFLLMYRQGWFHEAQWFYAGYMTPEYAVEREGVPLLEIYKAAVPQGEPGSGAESGLPGQWLTPQGLEWARFLVAPRDGLYRLVVWTPVNHRLELDDQPLERNEPEKAHNLWEYEFTLKKGPHPFELLFYRAEKLPRFYMAWSTPGGTKGSIPSQNLIPMDAPSSLQNQSFLEDPVDHP